MEINTPNLSNTHEYGFNALEELRVYRFNPEPGEDTAIREECLGNTVAKKKNTKNDITTSEVKKKNYKITDNLQE